jgi:hypothetical protein
MSVVVPTAAASLVPSMDSACIISDGSGSSSRRGNHIKLLNVNHKGVIRLPGDVAIAADGSTASQRVRVIMYYDNRTDSRAANTSVTLSDILAPTVSIQSFRNYDQASRFTILHDKTYELMNMGGSYAVGEFPAALYKKVKINKVVDLPCDFTDGTTVDTSTIARGNIGMFVFLDAITDGTVTMTYNAVTRVKFAGSGFPGN